MPERKFNPALLAVTVAGTQKKLADQLTPPVSRQAIAQWVRRGRIPPNRVPEVSRVTGIPKEKLNPIFAE